MFVDDADTEDSTFLRPAARTKSISVTEDEIDGIAVVSDDSFEFMEINSIPPLPIYALMAADDDNSAANMEIAGNAEPSNQQDYSELFSTAKEEILDLSDDDGKPKRLHSGSNNLQVGLSV